MEVTWTDIVGVVISGFIWITAVVALVIGCIYFNKKLKLYTYREDNLICLAACDKGNGACRITKAFYALKKKGKNNMTVISQICDNEVKIDMLPLGECKKVYFRVFDNFGRKYKKVYRNSAGNG